MCLQIIQLIDRSTSQASPHVRCPRIMPDFSAGKHKALDKILLLQLLQHAFKVS